MPATAISCQVYSELPACVNPGVSGKYCRLPNLPRRCRHTCTWFCHIFVALELNDCRHSTDMTAHRMSLLMHINRLGKVFIQTVSEMCHANDVKSTPRGHSGNACLHCNPYSLTRQSPTSCALPACLSHLQFARSLLLPCLH